VAASSICAAVGPRRIIIGGGVAHAGRLLPDPLESTMHERVQVMPVDQVEIVQASLGDNSGVIGSACWAANRLG
jgi:predicted NBD/HSP70 family sugar kinase